MGADQLSACWLPLRLQKPHLIAHPEFPLILIAHEKNSFSRAVHCHLASQNQLPVD